MIYMDTKKMWWFYKKRWSLEHSYKHQKFFCQKYHLLQWQVGMEILQIKSSGNKIILYNDGNSKHSLKQLFVLVTFKMLLEDYMLRNCHT